MAHVWNIFLHAYHKFKPFMYLNIPVPWRFLGYKYCFLAILLLTFLIPDREGGHVFTTFEFGSLDKKSPGEVGPLVINGVITPIKGYKRPYKMGLPGGITPISGVITYNPTCHWCLGPILWGPGFFPLGCH